MIVVEKVSKLYNGKKAVDEISFEVKEHENFILLGTSGCGKTTSLKMLNRLVEPDSGRILVNGKPVKEQAVETMRKGIGYVLQNTSLFPHYTVEENIGIVPGLLGWDRNRTRKRAAELMEKLHMPVHLMEAYPAQLSGGQQQRVGLARALAADPPVLLMDEPFGALDNVTRAKIQLEFKELDELKNKTIVMVTHDVQEAFQLGHRICLMHEGRIIQAGKPAELLFNPVNDFVRQFFKSQQRQLELMSVTLSDLGDLLPEKLRERKSLMPETTVWDALEQVQDKEAPGILLAAFYDFKNKRSDG